MEPVKFAQGMETLSQQKVQILLEIGPKPVLLGMGSHCLENLGSGYTLLPSLRPGKSDWQQLLASLGELYLKGLDIDWEGFESDYLPRNKLELPTYPFQRQSYWVKYAHTQQVSIHRNQQGSLLSLLNQGKSEQVKAHLENTANFSRAEIKLLPKFLKLLTEPNKTGDRQEAFIHETIKKSNSEQQRERILKANSSERKQLLKQYFIQLLTNVLKIKPSDLDWQQRLSSLGMDSLMATELRKKIETQFQIYVPVEFLAELNLEQFTAQLLCLIEKSGDRSNQNQPKSSLNLSSADNWLVRCQTKSPARYRLFCFPYAGGGASIFNNWETELPPEVEIVAVQLPGRENRLSESPLTRLKQLIKTLFPIIIPQLDLPFALFGHSLGAWIAFELIRELRRQKLSLPTHFFVSGSKAPQFMDLNPPIHRLPDEKFIAKIKDFQGTPEAVLQDTRLMEAYIPALRADFAILETYFYANQAPLNFPITAFGGNHDAQISATELRSWQQQTSSKFDQQMFNGGHFFLHSARQDLLKAISLQLERQLLVLD